MKPTDIACVLIWEDQGLTVLGRIRGNGAAYITIASLSTITCNVYDLSDNNASTGTPTVAVATSVFDALQTDYGWSKDTTGYNFRFTIPASCFPSGGKSYRVEFKFTPASGDSFYLARKVTTEDLIQS